MGYPNSHTYVKAACLNVRDFSDAAGDLWSTRFEFEGRYEQITGGGDWVGWQSIKISHSKFSGPLIVKRTLLPVLAAAGRRHYCQKLRFSELKWRLNLKFGVFIKHDCLARNG